tara:strand:- start:274 stop:693 length:420 start_codon:yes stop_codon:yes gene_type:complete
MIKYNLKCKKNHEFESWFSNSKEYEKLKRKKLIECIFCKSLEVEKTIMSPRIVNSKKISKTEVMEKELKKIKKDLINIKKFVKQNFEFVGDRFSKEVKNMYYDKKNNKNIYGTATEQEKEELQNEGIELTTIPWVKDDN